jgi:hypothetical protein
MFMLVAWVMGIGIGLIFTFLFWHLQVTLSTGTVSGEYALDNGIHYHLHLPSASGIKRLSLWHRHWV